MIVKTSDFGKKRLFYNDKNGKVFNSIKEIPGEKILNIDVLNIFLNTGYIPGTKTLIKNIECLPGGSKIEISKRKWEILEYFDYNKLINKATYFNLDEEDLIKEGKKIWFEVINKNYKSNSKIVLPISGGFDSRAILGGLGFDIKTDRDKKNYPVDAPSFGRFGTLERVPSDLGNVFAPELVPSTNLQYDEVTDRIITNIYK